MKKIQSFLVATTASLLLANVANASCCDMHKSGDKKSDWYVGVEGGMSYPIQSTFKKKIDVPGVGKVESKGKLSSSSMYGALLGYKFYPDMAIEFSWQKKPHYKLNISLPETIAKDLMPNIDGKSLATSAKVPVTSELYMLGLVYNLAKVKEFTPYVGVEFGIANIKAKKTIFTTDVALVHSPSGAVVRTLPNQESMVIKKSSSVSPAFQLSVGVNSPEIIPNLSAYTAARMQVIYNAQLKYDFLYNGQVTKSDKLKQSIAVGEIVMGLTYDLPF